MKALLIKQRSTHPVSYFGGYLERRLRKLGLLTLLGIVSV